MAPSSSSSSSSSVLSKVVANVDRVEMLPQGSVGTATACSFDIQSTGSGAETHGSQGTAATTSNFAMLSSGSGVIEVGGKGVVASTSAAAGIVATIAFNTGVEDLLIISLPFIILWAIVPQVLSQFLLSLLLLLLLLLELIPFILISSSAIVLQCLMPLMAILLLVHCSSTASIINNPSYNESANVLTHSTRFFKQVARTILFANSHGFYVNDPPRGQLSCSPRKNF
ncbi:hypothetical protein GQX74_015547 [Glossina fuscipes]|nr:hypothetical protein GQX74_015547 [Glossina fuscipes]